MKHPIVDLSALLKRTVDAVREIGSKPLLKNSELMNTPVAEAPGSIMRVVGIIEFDPSVVQEDAVNILDMALDGWSDSRGDPIVSFKVLEYPASRKPVIKFE